MERVIERLGQERDDLRRQIAVLRMDLERETAVSKNFKALQVLRLLKWRNDVLSVVVSYVSNYHLQDVLQQPGTPMTFLEGPSIQIATRRFQE